MTSATVTVHLRSALTLATLAGDEGLPAPFACNATGYDVSFGFLTTDDLAAWAVWLEAPVATRTAEAHPGKVFHDAAADHDGRIVQLYCVETVASVAS